MVADLESRAKSFEEEVARDIANSPTYTLINGQYYLGSIEIDLETCSKVEFLDWLFQHQDIYGNLHPAELDPRIKSSKMSSMLIEPTEEQAMNLAKAVDKAYCGDKENNPLKHIKKISIDTYLGYLT